MTRLFICSEEEVIQPVEVVEAPLEGDEITEAMETTEEAGSINAEVDNIDRSMDLAVALEEIIEAIGGDTGLTSREQNILTIAGNMATAGTGVEGQAVVPALESGDVKLATEAIAEKIAGALKAIVGSISNLIKRIKDFFARIIYGAKKYSEKLKYLKNEINALKQKGVKTCKSITVKSHKNFTSDNKALTDMPSILGAVSVWSGFSDRYLKSIVNHMQVIDSGDQGILTTLKKATFDSREYATELFNLTRKTSMDVPKALGAKPGVDIKAIKEYTCEVPLTGYTLVFNTPKLDNVDTDNYKEIKKYTNSMRTYVRKTDFADLKHGDMVTLNNVQLKDLEKMVDESLDFFTSFLKYADGINNLLDNANRRANLLLAILPVISVAGAAITLTSLLFAGVRMMFNHNNYNWGLISNMHSLFFTPSNSIAWFVRDIVKRGHWE